MDMWCKVTYKMHQMKPELSLVISEQNTHQKPCLLSRRRTLSSCPPRISSDYDQNTQFERTRSEQPAAVYARTVHNCAQDCARTKSLPATAAVLKNLRWLGQMTAFEIALAVLWCHTIRQSDVTSALSQVGYNLQKLACSRHNFKSAADRSEQRCMKSNTPLDIRKLQDFSRLLGSAAMHSEISYGEQKQLWVWHLWLFVVWYDKFA